MIRQIYRQRNAGQPRPGTDVQDALSRTDQTGIPEKGQDAVHIMPARHLPVGHVAQVHQAVALHEELMVSQEALHRNRIGLNAVRAQCIFDDGRHTVHAADPFIFSMCSIACSIAPSSVSWPDLTSNSTAVQ